MRNKPKQEVAPFIECKTCKRRHRSDIKHQIKITTKARQQKKRIRKVLRKKKQKEQIEEISREMEAEYLHQMERD